MVSYSGTGSVMMSAFSLVQHFLVIYQCLHALEPT